MKLPLWQWILGFLGLGILIFFVFNEFGKKAQKDYIAQQIQKIKDEMSVKINNPSGRSTGDLGSLAMQYKRLRNYQKTL